MKKHYIAHRIKNKRKIVGWSQAELSRRAGVTSAAICQIELGDRCPSIPVLQKLAKALKTTLALLVDEENYRSDKEIDIFYRKFSILESLIEKDQVLILDIAERLLDKN